MSKFVKIFLIISILFVGCKTKPPITTDTELEEIVVKPKEKKPEPSSRLKYKNPYTDYRAAATKTHSLIHTKLDISFDIPNELVFGTAEITMQVHFYASDSVIFDAQGFDIHKTALIDKDRNQHELKHSYNGKQLTIYTPKFERAQPFTLLVEYTAMPSKLTNKGSAAGRDGKGLYFQDPQSDNPQIWTQGQPNSNSGWFPTIDQPNQRMSQDIFITVNREFETLSNGTKVSVLLNDDGTKTVHWKQEKPHAPYLTAIIAGRFEIIKYYWRSKPVYVYAEPENIEKAAPTFKKTTKMIEFFSRLFKYDYPWDKYSQVIVRNFVSGAMENTGAVIYSEYFLSDPKADFHRPTHELIVAHELLHHWFGNVVTCESWANLTLNEAFGTYAEYLWLEHEYSRFHADRHIAESTRYYFFEASYKNEDLIRFYHSSSGDMFDMHSYNKGAAILHMLRYELGSEAFFASLAHYLKKHEYQSVEVHELRRAFEDITGKDLNYFFNAWFLNKGFLELDIEYKTQDSLTWKIIAEQIQQPADAPLYKHNVPVDFYFADTLIRKTVLLNQEIQTFEFSFPEKVKLVKFDAENSLLAKKTENRNIDDYIYIMKNIHNYNDQLEAAKYLIFFTEEDKAADAFISLLNSPYYLFRKMAMDIIPLDSSRAYHSRYLQKLQSLAKKDPDPLVRQTAQELLSETE